jgi:hypothetical protein
MHEKPIKSSGIFFKRIIMSTKNSKKVYKGLETQGKI